MITQFANRLDAAVTTRAIRRRSYREMPQYVSLALFLNGLCQSDYYSYALPVANPSKIVCLGLNYTEHVNEGRYADNVPRFPTYFLRVISSLTPHNAPMIRPRISGTFDYKVELAPLCANAPGT